MGRRFGDVFSRPPQLLLLFTTTFTSVATSVLKRVDGSVGRRADEAPNPAAAITIAAPAPAPAPLIIAAPVAAVPVPVAVVANPVPGDS